MITDMSVDTDAAKCELFIKQRQPYAKRIRAYGCFESSLYNFVEIRYTKSVYFRNIVTTKT